MTARPLVLAAEAGELVQTQVRRLVKAAGADTDNALSFAVVSLEEGFQGPPLHRHLRNAEAFYVLKGAFRFVVGESECRVDEGGFVFVPPMTAHTFVSADGGGGTMIELFTPADFEGYFAEIAGIIASGGASSDIEAAQAKYGMVVLGPPLGVPHV